MHTHPHFPDPRGTHDLLSATAHLLGVVGERLEAMSTLLSRHLDAEPLSAEALVDLGRVAGLAELAQAESALLVRLALEEWDAADAG